MSKQSLQICAFALASLLAAGCDDAETPAGPGPTDAPAETHAGSDAPKDAGAEVAAVGPDAEIAKDATAAPETTAIDAATTDVAATDGAATDAADAPLPGTSTPTEKLDLIFMIDNSTSMAQEQAAMKAAFPAFITALAARPGGLPDLHIAFISSNVGAGPGQPAAECPPGGDRGHFQILPTCGVDPAAISFLSVGRAGTSNFPGGPGNLSPLFQCLSQLGTKGCGYEHPLLSLYFALDGKTNSANGGFLRDDAVLGVVMLSDEDDCSGTPTADFFEGSTAGQSGSLRCSLRGHVCGGQAVPAMPFSSPLSACAPYQRSPGEENSRLIDVNFFVDNVKALKRGNLARIFVATIIGWDDNPAAQYTIRQINTVRGLELDTGPICDNPATGSAAPGIRLHSFAKAFTNNAVHSICAGDLSVSMADIATKVAALLGPAKP